MSGFLVSGSHADPKEHVSYAIERLAIVITNSEVIAKERPEQLPQCCYELASILDTLLPDLWALVPSLGSQSVDLGQELCVLQRHATDMMRGVVDIASEAAGPELVWKSPARCQELSRIAFEKTLQRAERLLELSGRLRAAVLSQRAQDVLVLAPSTPDRLTTETTPATSTRLLDTLLLQLPELFTVSDAARCFGCPEKSKALNTVLSRHRKSNRDCATQIPNPRTREPRWLYRKSDLLAVLKAWLSGQGLVRID